MYTSTASPRGARAAVFRDSLVARSPVSVAFKNCCGRTAPALPQLSLLGKNRLFVGRNDAVSGCIVTNMIVEEKHFSLIPAKLLYSTAVKKDRSTLRLHCT